jgi:hypothetical protein
VVLVVPIDSESPKCHKFDKFWKKVHFLAELRCSESAGLSSHMHVSKSQILSQIRSKGHLHKPYIKGKCVSIENCIEDEALVFKKVSIQFNSDHHAWHYGWISHKHTSDMTHVVDVSVFVANKHTPDTFFNAGSFASPEFTLSCTKRQKIVESVEKQVSQEVNIASFMSKKRARLDRQPLQSHELLTVEPSVLLGEITTTFY